MFHDQIEKKKISSAEEEKSLSNEQQFRVYLDVDDTTMINNPDALAFNTYLIKKLKELDVIRVILLTRMDAKKFSITSPIRIPLIEYLASEGITIERVVTPLDLLYKDAKHNDFNPGDAYNKYMRPVEQAIVKIRKIPEKDYNVYRIYYDQLRIVNAIKYLHDHLKIDGETTIWHVKAYIESKGEAIENHIYTAYPQESAENPLVIDYPAIFDILPNFLEQFVSRHPEPTTLKGLIEHYEETVSFTGKMTSKLSPEEYDDIYEYQAKLTQYRNQQFHAYLTKFRNKLASEADNKEKENATISPSHSDSNYTKGSAYAWDVEVNPLAKNEVVIFIDDHRKEHDSLLDVHINKKLENIFLVSLPPTCEGGFILSIEQKAFDKFIRKCQWMSSLMCHLQDHFNDQDISVTKRDLHMKYFNDIGVDLAQNRNCIAAIIYFQIAYLFCQHPAYKHEKEISEALSKNKSEIVQNIILAKRDCTKDVEHYSTVVTLNNSQTDHLWLILKKTYGFSLEIQMLDLAALIHKVNHPKVYRSSLMLVGWSSLSIFNKKTDEPDQEFKRKIIMRAQYLASIYPDKKDICIDFLNKLKDQLTSDSYKNCISHAIQEISKQNSNECHEFG